MRKPVFGVSDQARHKLGCTLTEDGKRLEILCIGSRGIVISYNLCSENKDADHRVDSRIFSKWANSPIRFSKGGPRFRENGEPHEFTEMQHIFCKVYNNSSLYIQDILETKISINTDFNTSWCY